MTLVQFNASDSLPVLHRAEKKEMLSVSRAKDGRTLVKINSSSLAIIQECPRKAFYSLVEGWRSENESPATLFGRSIHRALEVFYSGDPAERELPSQQDYDLLAWGHEAKMDSLVVRAVKAFCETAEPLKSLPETDKRSIQNGVWILSHYFKTYKDDPYIVMRDKDGPFIERQFTFRLFEDDTIAIDYFGTIDAVKQHKLTKDILCVDYKTTSMLSGYGDNSSFLEKDKPNSQYTGYLLGLREVYGIANADFCVDIIEVKAKPKTARGSSPQFPRQITRRDENDFEEFRESVVKYVRDFLQMRISGIWPIGPVSSCNLWGACSYKQVCASPKNLRETILQNKFIRGTDAR